MKPKPFKPTTKLSAMNIYDLMFDVAQTVIGKTTAYEFKTGPASLLRHEWVLQATHPRKRPTFGSNLKKLVFAALGNSMTKVDTVWESKSPRSFCQCPINELMREGCHCGGT